jgi:hypothetical protein
LTQSTTTASVEESEIIDLRDPWLAALLAWLVPGWGHWYQRRRAKALLFFVCIMGTYAFGMYLGEGRVVYASWRPEDHRLPYICQVGVGLPSLPALVQAQRFRNPDLQLAAAERQKAGDPRFSDWFMAPPFVYDQELFGARQLTISEEERRTTQLKLLQIYNKGQPDNEDHADELDLINRRLHRYFEFGTVYTMIAGLLNILAIYDAFGGPAQSDPIAPRRGRKKDDEDEPEADNDTAKG